MRDCRRAGDQQVHDWHGWESTLGFSALSAHVLVGSENNCHATCRRFEALLYGDFEIEHTGFQVVTKAVSSSTSRCLTRTNTSLH